MKNREKMKIPKFVQNHFKMPPRHQKTWFGKKKEAVTMYKKVSNIWKYVNYGTMYQQKDFIKHSFAKQLSYFVQKDFKTHSLANRSIYFVRRGINNVKIWTNTENLIQKDRWTTLIVCQRMLYEAVVWCKFHIFFIFSHIWSLFVQSRTTCLPNNVFLILCCTK